MEIPLVCIKLLERINYASFVSRWWHRQHTAVEADITKPKQHRQLPRQCTIWHVENRSFGLVKEHDTPRCARCNSLRALLNRNYTRAEPSLTIV